MVILTNKLLRHVLQKHEMSGHLIQWTMELSKFDIQYNPRSAIKSQALANFIIEYTIPDDAPPVYQERTTKKDPGPSSQPWIQHRDGSSTLSASGAKVILTNPTGEAIEYALHFIFSTSNNEAKYEVLITDLKLAKELRISELKVFSDS